MPDVCGRGKAPWRIWTSLGDQLRRPTGRSGRIIGLVMDRLNKQVIRETVQALRVQPGDRVLEIGFGTGLGITMLRAAGHGVRISGIDHSSEMLAAARRTHRTAVAQGCVELVGGSAARLPWVDETFHKVMAVNVAYFFGADGAEMREAYRVLRPTGFLALFVTDRSAMQNWPFAGANTHRLYDTGDLVASMVSAGFAASTIAVAECRLPLGVTGLIATARKVCHPGRIHRNSH